jgi:pre-60S factor REI1
MVFSTREELHEHYKSEWHRYNLRRRAAGLAPINKEVFDKVRALAASQEKQSEHKQRKQDHVASKNKRKDEEKSQVTEDKEDEEEAEEQDGKEESMETKVRKAMEHFEPNPCRCIWDGHVSESVESNLEHMHRHHGFLVHDLSSVINLPGLVNYLAEKVHVGRICLYCEREFRASAACIAHMTSKGHCRIPWEYEDQIEEFVEYYDFSTAEAEASEQTGTLEMDMNTGELILKDADGSVKRLGPSKQFRNVYRALKAESRASVDPAIANAVKERSLQVYRSAGLLTTSTALTVDLKRRLHKRANFLQDRCQRKFHDITIKNGLQVNYLIKDRKAGTNVGAGHGVHG